MSYDPLYYLQASETVADIPELSVVALREALTLEDARVLPAEAEGTVVAAWGDGKGYVVEFDQPFHAVATVESEQIREVVRFGA